MISPSTRPRLRALIALLLAGAVAGCGEEAAPPATAIPPEASKKLLGLLEEADEQYADGECEELGMTIGQLRAATASTAKEDDVDPAVIDTLTSGIDRLNELQAQCEPVTTAPVTTAPITTAPVEPETTAPVEPPPTVTEEETTTEETTVEETTTEEEEPPEEPPGGGPPETPPGQENGGNSGQGGD